MRKYRQVDLEAFTAKINLQTDPLWLLLMGTSYLPQPDTHKLSTDLTGELPTGGGYTAGGMQIAGQGFTYTTAGAWPTTWTASTAHAVEDVVRPNPANGYLYRCSVAGTSAATPPTWPLGVGQTVTDGSVTWECCGGGVTALTASNETWPAPFTAGPIGSAVIVDKIVTPGILIAYSTFSPAITGQGGSFVEQFNPSGVFYLFES